MRLLLNFFSGLYRLSEVISIIRNLSFVVLKNRPIFLTFFWIGYKMICNELQFFMEG